MRALFLALALLLVSAPVLAQGHPCDVTPATSVTLNEGVLPVGWCYKGPTVTGWFLYANTVRTSLTNVVTDGIPNALGEVFYHGSVNMTRGNYTVSIAGVNGSVEGPKSPPFQLSVVGPTDVPAAPSKVRMSQQ